MNSSAIPYELTSKYRVETGWQTAFSPSSSSSLFPPDLAILHSNLMQQSVPDLMKRATPTNTASKNRLAAFRVMPKPQPPDTLDVKNDLDPWATKSSAKRSKTEPEPGSGPVAQVDLESDSEDDSFTGGSSSDSSSGSDDDSSDSSDSSENVAPAARTDKRQRQRQQELQELALKFGVQLEDDDGPEDEIGDDSDDDDDDDEEDFIDDDDDDDGGMIIREDSTRVHSALGFKTVVRATDSKRSGNDPSMGAKAAANEHIDSLMARIQKDHCDEETDPDSETESPTFKLVKFVTQTIDVDESDLSELIASLSRKIFSEALAIYKPGSPMPTDLTEKLYTIAKDDRFCNRCDKLIMWLVNRTKNRPCGSFFSAVAAAYSATYTTELRCINFTVTDTTRNIQCAHCTCDIALADGANDTKIASGVDVVQRKSRNIKSKDVKLTSDIQTRPPGDLASARFWVCSKCAITIPFINGLIVFKHDLLMLAQAWILQHANNITVTSGPGAEPLQNAFHAWNKRVELCNSIIASYKLAHAIALD